MYVLVESSILCGDFHLEGVAFQLLRDGIRNAGFQLVVPEVVVDEVVNKYREELQEAQLKIQNLAKRVNHLLKTDHLSQLSDEIIKEATEKYAKKLREILLSCDATLIPYPDISHKEVVQRELNRKKPFSERGTGYRDFLIWESAINLLSNEDSLAFISANPKDFADANAQLHSDLKDDLVARGIDCNRVVYSKSLKDFVEQHIKPSLEIVTDIQAQLASDSHPDFSLKNWLEHNSLPILQGVEWESDYIDLPIYYLEIRPASIKSVESVEIRDVRKLSSGEFFIYFDAVLTCEFEYSRRNNANPAPPDSYSGPRWERVPGEEYVRESQVLKSGVGFQLVFDPQKKEVISTDIVSFFG